MKLKTLLKRNFLYEAFSTKFLRSYPFEVLWVASFERVYKESNNISRCQQSFKNAFFTEHLLIEKLQGKHLYRSPVLPMLKEMPCDFIKVGFYQEHFQKNLETCFGTDLQQKTIRIFVFKIKALYFFSQLLCFAVFELDKHVMITRYLFWGYWNHPWW